MKKAHANVSSNREGLTLSRNRKKLWQQKLSASTEKKGLQVSLLQARRGEHFRLLIQRPEVIAGLNQQDTEQSRAREKGHRACAMEKEDAQQKRARRRGGKTQAKGEGSFSGCGTFRIYTNATGSRGRELPSSTSFKEKASRTHGGGTQHLKGV